MFDCLDTSASAYGTYGCDRASLQDSTIDARTVSQQLARRHAGRNWLRLSAGKGQQTLLAKAREVALYFEGQIERLPDGSLLILDLTLNETLALSERFGRELALEASIAGQGHYS